MSDPTRFTYTEEEHQASEPTLREHKLLERAEKAEAALATTEEKLLVVESSLRLSIATVKIRDAERDALAQKVKDRDDAAETAWGIIANALDWNTKDRQHWITAAERWRDRYHETLPKSLDDGVERAAREASDGEGEG